MGYSVYHIWCPLSSPQHLLLLYRRHRHTAGTHTIFFPLWYPPYRPTGKREFCTMVRRWYRSVEIHGLKVLKHKKRNRVWTAEERFALNNPVLSRESFTSVATSAGIPPGRLCTWVHKYKETGYIGLIDCRKKWKPKESHIKKHKHNQPEKHKDSEHEALIRLRTENKLFKAENAAKKK